jgi:hypothetical protein
MPCGARQVHRIRSHSLVLIFGEPTILSSKHHGCVQREHSIGHLENVMSRKTLLMCANGEKTFFSRGSPAQLVRQR